MNELIINTIENFGYIGVMILITIENLFPPIPSELILAFSGFIADSANLSLWLIILFATFGSLIGAAILYFFGSKFLSNLNISKAFKCYNDTGYMSILLCRFVPIVRSLISIPAGIKKVNFFLFLVLTFIGSIIWNAVIVLAGDIMGSNWEVISIYLDRYKLIFIGILIIYIIYKIIKRVKR